MNVLLDVHGVGSTMENVTQNVKRKDVDSMDLIAVQQMIRHATQVVPVHSAEMEYATPTA